MSSSTGWQFAGQGNNSIFRPGGPDEAWVNPGNVTADDGVNATIAKLDNTEESDWIVAANFGFAIPTDAVIGDIFFDMERILNNGGAGLLWDEDAYLMASVTASVSDNKASGTWLTTSHIKEYSGDIASYWNATPLVDATFLNSSLFGFALAVRASADNQQDLRIDYIRAKVDYNLPPNEPWNIEPTGDILTLLPTFTGNVYDQDGDVVTHVRIVVRRVSDQFVMWDNGGGDIVTAQGGGLHTFSVGYSGFTLSDDIAYEWQAQCKDDQGDWGAWTAWTTFTPKINDKPTAVLNSPEDESFPGTLTPVMAGIFSDPDVGDEIDSYQVLVRRVSDQVSFWDSGIVVASASEKQSSLFAIIYAGTTLVSQTQYEWRARVRDDGLPTNLWSDYSAWWQFTPALAPSAPTYLITSPQSTLTPLFNGVYIQGLGAAEESFQYQVRDGQTQIYDSGEVVGDILTGQTYGTSNPNDSPDGAPALEWGKSTYSVRMRSKDINDVWSEYGSWNGFSTNSTPTMPTNLSPDGAIIGDTTPTLSWTHNDPDGDIQESVQIKLQDVATSTPVTGYDPKILTQATLTHDVTQTLQDVPAKEYKWQASTRGAVTGPGYSPYSAWVEFTVSQAPTITVDEPDPDDVVLTPALLVDWSLTGGGNQADYRVVIYTSDQTTIAYDTGVVVSAMEQHQILSGVLANNQTYYVQIFITDDVGGGQEANTSKIRFTTSWTPPDTITGLSAQVVE